jgi:hypothetical protein
MKQRFTNLKTSLKTLALGFILIALPLTGIWLLANWLSATNVSWLAVHSISHHSMVSCSNVAWFYSLYDL